MSVPSADRRVVAEMSLNRENFTERKQRIMHAGTPSGGDDLLGMEMDFHAYLYGLDEIDDDSVSARRTGEAARLISATCSPADGVRLLQLVRPSGRRGWSHSVTSSPRRTTSSSMVAGRPWRW